MRLLLATSNPRKIEDFNRVFGRHGIPLAVVPYDEPEPQAETVEEVSIWKARYAFQRYKTPVVVTDFGVHFDALGGFPGPGLKLVQKQLGLDGLLRTLRKLDPSDRHVVGHESHDCRFVNAVAYFDGELKRPVAFSHAATGTLDPTLYSAMRLGPQDWLEKLFRPDGLEMAVGQMRPFQFENWRKSPANEAACVEMAMWIVRHRPQLRDADLSSE